MKKNIEELYHTNIQLIDQIDQAIIYFRKLNYDRALRLTTSILVELEKSINNIVVDKEYFTDIYNMDWIVNVLSSIMEAQEHQDYILLADLLEVQLIPLVEQYQTWIVRQEAISINKAQFEKNYHMLIEKNSDFSRYELNIDEIIRLGYQIEYTSSGMFTVSYEQNHQKQYLHSNNHPMKEAFLLAESWYSEEKTTYIVAGLGLGYHIRSLAELDENIQIEVYEQDRNMLALFCAFTDTEKLLSDNNIKVIYDPEFSKLYSRISNITDEEEFVVYAPSLKQLQDNVNRERLENYFLQYSSYKNQSKLLKGNFRSNIKNYDHVIDEFRDKFKNKDLYIIAAGPSLDKNYKQLKERSKDSIVLATGTVFNKLVQAGIDPDYVIVTDANQRVIGQISGNEENSAKLILLSSAYKGFALRYQGERLIVFQKNFELSGKYATAHGYHQFQTGGSVSTLALDIGIEFRCRRIIFLGLDLGYTDNFVHAENTSRRTLFGTDNLRKIRDINGKLIYTSKSLDTFRKWIEKRIKDCKDIEIIDATEGGALIKGMKLMSLEEVLRK